MPRLGRSPLGFEGQTTGDGRIIAPGALRWDGDRWPVAWAAEDWGMHQGAVDVGAITELTRNGEAIMGAYEIDTGGDAGAEVARQHDAGIPLGWSLDLDDITVEIVDMTVEIVDEDAPVDDDDEELALAAAALARPAVTRVHVDHMTLTSTGRTLEALTADGVVIAEWSPNDYLERVTDARVRRATIVSTPAFAEALFTLDAATDGETVEPEPVAASSGGCGCGGSCGHCGTVTAGGGERRMFTGPKLPPTDWYNDPGFGEPTPLDITDKGVAFGHVARWDTCHTGSPSGECIRAPRSLHEYAYYRTGARPTSGGRIPVGQLTIGGGHADLQLSYRGAAEHYDNASTALADVACGEDAYGIWFAGALRPGVSDEDVIAMLASSLSGDWRAIGGHLELIAAHAVNVPGFPLARVASGAPAALVAAGCLPPRQRTEPEPDIAELVARGVALYETRRETKAAEPHRRRLRQLATDRQRDRLRSLG